MVVSGRVVSPANVSPVVLRLPQVIAVTYLNVPFDEKEAAKAKGARWDTVHKKWFVPPLVDLAPFRRWNLGKKVILRTTYADKEEVRRLGARWDPSINEWYVTDNMDLSNFAQWLPVGDAAHGTPQWAANAAAIHAAEARRASSVPATPATAPKRRRVTFDLPPPGDGEASTSAGGTSAGGDASTSAGGAASVALPSDDTVGELPHGNC